MKNIIRLTPLFIFVLLLGSSCGGQKDVEAPLALTWEVIQSNHNGTNRTLNELTIKNTSKDEFGGGEWVVYFNGGEVLVEPADSSKVNMSLINGDFLSMAPGPDFPVLQPGDSLVLQVTMRPLINLAKAPHGFYIISDAFPEGKTLAISHKPNREADIRDVQLAQRFYEENSQIESRSSAQIPAVFPTPVAFTVLPGEFTLTGAFQIDADPRFQSEATYFETEMALLLQSSGQTTNVRFHFVADMQPESYRMIMDEQGLLIAASDRPGIFYGIQSLKNMLPSNLWAKKEHSVTFAACEITDFPRFHHRAFELDVARNFHSKEQVLKLLDLLAFYKINVLHFHLNDDEGWRLEIPGLPELTEVGGRRGHTLDEHEFLVPSYASGPSVTGHEGSGHYTRADYIEILKYARDRHIQVIPEIETPGHARAAIKSMEARYRNYMAKGDTVKAEEYLLQDPNDQSEYRSVQHWTGNVIDVTLPSTYQFLEKVIDEVQAMYLEADAPLRLIHMGGDEVPGGVWERSPAVLSLMASDPTINHVDDLWYYFFDRMAMMLEYKGLAMVGWEEVGMTKTMVDGVRRMVVDPRLKDRNLHVNVWNNVGANADLAYRMANAGYQVILTNVTNLYFDMAYNTSYYERGQHWGGYVDVDKPFRFVPYEQYKSLIDNNTGLVVDQEPYRNRVRLTEEGRNNIIGLQAALWSEFNVGSERLEYLLLPKLLGMVERAWAQAPVWEELPIGEEFHRSYLSGWSEFIHTVGLRELPRLDHMNGGFLYRIPTPGIKEVDGQIRANVQIPGMVIRYTTDGTEPTANSPVYEQTLAAGERAIFKVFNKEGRGGRSQKWGYLAD